jgi:hypothetical protein
LERLYSYNLLNRNCVTEIFAAINRAMEQGFLGRNGSGPASAPAIRDESVRRLGGFIDGSRGLTFVPFVSAAEVSGRYTVVAQREIPSYRRRLLAEMQERESPLVVMVRESNTVTSTAYRPGSDDSSFLFFTDGQPLLRPVLGACNLLYGVGDTLLGLLTMPVNGPRRLISGARGMLFSLPELLFINIRKGTAAYAGQLPEEVVPEGSGPVHVP